MHYVFVANRAKVGNEEILLGMRLAISQSIEWGEPLYIVALDISDAFGSLDLVRLWKCLRDKGKSARALQLYKMMVGCNLQIRWDSTEIGTIQMLHAAR